MSKTSYEIGGGPAPSQKYASIIMAGADCPGAYVPSNNFGPCAGAYLPIGNTSFALNPLASGPVNGLSVNLNSGGIVIASGGTFLLIARLAMYPDGINDRVFFRVQNALSGNLFNGIQDVQHEQNTLAKTRTLHSIFTHPAGPGLTLQTAISCENGPATGAFVHSFEFSIMELLT